MPMTCPVHNYNYKPVLFVLLVISTVLSVSFGIGLYFQRTTYLRSHTIVPCTITNMTITSYRHCQASDCQCQECGVTGAWGKYTKHYPDCTNSSLNSSVPCCSDERCTYSTCSGKPTHCTTYIKTHHKLCLSYCSTYHDLTLHMDVGNSTILVYCRDDDSCASKYSVNQRFWCIKDKDGLKFGDHVGFDGGSIALLVFTCVFSACLIVVSIVVCCCFYYDTRLTYKSKAFNALDGEL